VDASEGRENRIRYWRTCWELRYLYVKFLVVRVLLYCNKFIIIEGEKGDTSSFCLVPGLL